MTETPPRSDWVLATQSATAAIMRLYAHEGAIAIRGSGGAAVPTKMPRASNEIQLGEVGGLPFLIDRDEYEAGGCPRLLVDTERPGGEHLCLRTDDDQRRDAPRRVLGRRPVDREHRLKSESRRSPRSGVPLVLVAGGGVAGLEAMLALRALMGAGVEIIMVAPTREFVYKPFAVGEPFARAEANLFDLAKIADDCEAQFIWDSVSSVDPVAREATPLGRDPIRYDFLVVASGVELFWPFPGATTFWGAPDEPDIEQVIWGAREGRHRRVAFTLPGDSSWTLPLYELALLTKAELANASVPPAEVLVATPEDAPLQVFGHRASSEVGDLLAEREIQVITATYPVAFRSGALETVPDRRIRADAVVSLPRLEGRRIDGIPHDENGFVPTDERGHINGLERAFAIGDVTSFPVRQGGIATQQADLVAEAIAAETSGGQEPSPFDPVLRGVLWTGEEPRYLYAEIGGGHGETSQMSKDASWSAEGAKIIGRFLTPYLSRLAEADSA